MLEYLRKLFTILILLAFTSCATGTALVVGKPRNAINFESVKFYLEEPETYETIAIVEASSSSGFSSQQRQDYATEELKKQAAKLGANGILITPYSSQTLPVFETYTIKAKAIFVPTSETRK